MTPGMRIVYRIVDEYGTRLRFKPGQSTQPPLSMGELIALTDGATGGRRFSVALRQIMLPVVNEDGAASSRWGEPGRC